MIRAIIILILGALMALMVYAGQMPAPQPTTSAPAIGRRIYQSFNSGYAFSYRVVDAAAPVRPCQNLPYALALFPHASRLLLSITDASGQMVAGARVRYRFVGPGRHFLEVGGFPLVDGYAAGVHGLPPGQYQIEAAIELPDNDAPVVDNFSFHTAL